eukprot:7729910-Alexandrium_andersonii.AAC.1
MPPRIQCDPSREFSAARLGSSATEPRRFRNPSSEVPRSTLRNSALRSSTASEARLGSFTI